LAVGTLLFAYGGHPAFPTIQNDMRKPEDFEKSSLLSFSSLFLYLKREKINSYTKTPNN